MGYAFKTMMAAGALAMSVSGAAKAADYSLISAPFGSGSYVLGAALEQIVSANSTELRISHSESPGFVFNLQQLQKNPDLRKTMIIGTGRGTATLAAEGAAPFTEKMPPIKALANYNLGSNFLVTLKDDIKTPADLKGKRVGLGRRPQINWTIQPEAILRNGAGLGQDVTVEYLGLNEAVAALLDGQVDAAIVGGYFEPGNFKMEMSPHTTEFLAAGRKYHFLSWGQPQVEKAIAAGMPMSAVTIPASSLPGSDKPLEGFADTISWGVSEEFPEDAAYQIVKLLIAHVGEFEKYHALGKLMTKESLPYGWAVAELHPGALRAYREAGLVK